LRIGELLERTKRERRSRTGGFVVKRTERWNHAGQIFGAAVALHHGDALGEERHRAAAVSDDEAEVRAALQRPGVDQIDDGARRVKDIFDGEGRRMQTGVLRRFAVGRMDKNRRLAPVELVEQWIEQRIAQVAVINAGKKANTVEVQDVERIG